jgi:hypothetical protein
MTTSLCWSHNTSSLTSAPGAELHGPTPSILMKTAPARSGLPWQKPEPKGEWNGNSSLFSWQRNLYLNILFLNFGLAHCNNFWLIFWWCHCWKLTMYTHRRALPQTRYFCYFHLQTDYFRLFFRKQLDDRQISIWRLNNWNKIKKKRRDCRLKKSV